VAGCSRYQQHRRVCRGCRSCEAGQHLPVRLGVAALHGADDGRDLPLVINSGAVLQQTCCVSTPGRLRRKVASTGRVSLRR
jgi:hypothetical protein